MKRTENILLYEITPSPTDKAFFTCQLKFPIKCPPINLTFVSFQPDTKDLLNPINFQITYGLEEKIPPPLVAGQRLPEINDYPTYNQKDASKMFMVWFDTFLVCCPKEISGVVVRFLVTRSHWVRILFPSVLEQDT
jgi:hypothetical protein